MSKGKVITVHDWGKHNTVSRLAKMHEAGREGNVEYLDIRSAMHAYNAKWAELTDLMEMTEEESPFAMDGEAIYLDIRLQDRHLYLVLAMQPFSSEAMRMIKNNILPRAIPSPKDWLFLIEGGLDAILTPEAEYGVLCAEDLGINIEDPIVPAFNTYIPRSIGVNKYSAIQAYVMKHLPQYQAADRTDELIDNTARIFEDSRQYVREVITNTLEEMASPHDKRVLTEKIDHDWKMLRTASLDLSFRRLDKLLKQHKNPIIFAYANNDYQNLFLGQPPKDRFFTQLEYEDIIDNIKARNMPDIDANNE